MNKVKNLEGTISFTTCCGKFRFTVKEEFFNKWFNPESYETYQLFVDFKMKDYLHSTKGPASLDLQTGYESFWFNGEAISQEHFYKYVFKKKVLKELSD